MAADEPKVTGDEGGAATDPGRDLRADDDVPEATAADCPACGEETVHDVLKARGRERTVRCRRCGRTHAVVAPREVRVPVHVSRGGQTVRDVLETTEDVKLSVGDRLFVAGAVAEVTAVEDAEGRRPSSLPAPDVRALWAKDVQEAPVRVTVHEGRRSLALETVLGPQEEVVVGEVMVVDGERVRVDRIKVEGAMLRRRGQVAKAGDVVRVYGYWDAHREGKDDDGGDDRDAGGGTRGGRTHRGRRR